MHIITNLSLALLLAIIPTSALLGQVVENEGDYFARTIESGRVLDAPQWADKRKVNIAYLSDARESLWAMWLRAAARVDNVHLPGDNPLSQAVSGRLRLPDSLEHSAIMPFYWGHKGDICLDKGSVSLPTFVYLHGSGPKDTEWAASLQWAQVFADAPSRYFIPQIPQEGAYYRWWQQSKQWAWRWLWRQLMQQPSLDPDRVYLFGISEGGYGSQRLSAYYADYLAAAGPMAGGEPLINAPAENLEHIGFSLLTGAKDLTFCRNRFTEITGEALDSLEKQHSGSYAHKVSLIEGRGHGIDYRPMTPWLLQFRRNHHPRHFTWEDFELDGCHRQGFYNLRIMNRPADSLRTKYEVSIDKAGLVDIKVSSVRYIEAEKDSVWNLTLRWKKQFLQPTAHGTLMLYLDEDLVDLGKPVVIRLNGNVVYRGKPHLSYRHMLESLAAFSDPRRIYPVGIKLEY